MGAHMRWLPSFLIHAVLGALTLTPASAFHDGLHERLARADEAVAQRPDAAEPRLWRAALRRLHEDPAGARDDLAAAAARDPQLPGLHHEWARLLLELDCPAAALDQLDRLGADEAREADALELGARAQARIGNLHAAAALWDQRLALDSPAGPDLLLEATAADRALGGELGLAAARRRLAVGLARLGPQPALLLRDSELAVESDCLDEALQRLDELAALSPRRERWLALQGDLIWAAGLGWQAQGCYRAALRALDGLPRRLSSGAASIALREHLAGRLVALAPPALPIGRPP